MYQKLIDYLEAAIAAGHLKPGGRLPPLRELCRQFSLSMGTVQRAIAQLEERGLVEGKRGSGVYVRSSAVKAKRSELARVAVIIESARTEVSYCAHALRGVQEVADKAGMTLTIHFVHGPTFLNKVEAACADCDFLLMLGCFDDRILTLPKTLPAVGLEIHRDYDGRVSPITIDPWRIAELAVDYFRKKEVREVVVCMEQFPAHFVRRDLFAALWAPHGVLRYHYERVYGCDALPALTPGTATGILFCGGTYCERLTLAYRAGSGKLLQDDFPVLSIDGKSILVPAYQQVDTISTDWVEAGRVAMNECLRRLQSPGGLPRRIYLGAFYSSR